MDCEWRGDARNTAVRARQRLFGVQVACQGGRPAAKVDEQGAELECVEEAAVEGGGGHC